MTIYFNHIKMPEQFSKAWEQTQNYCGPTFTPFWQEKAVPFWEHTVVAGWNNAVENPFQAVATATTIAVCLLAAKTFSDRLIKKYATSGKVLDPNYNKVKQRVVSCTAASIFTVFGNGAYVLHSHLRDTPMTQNAFLVVSLASALIGYCLSPTLPAAKN